MGHSQPLFFGEDEFPIWQSAMPVLSTKIKAFNGPLHLLRSYAIHYL